jgi:hypothetical protein
MAAIRSMGTKAARRTSLITSGCGGEQAG